MGAKEQQLEVYGFSEGQLADLKAWCEQFGKIRNAFCQPPGVGRVTFDVEADADRAFACIRDIPRHIRHGQIKFASKKKQGPPRGGSGTPGPSADRSTSGYGRDSLPPGVGSGSGSGSGSGRVIYSRNTNESWNTPNSWTPAGTAFTHDQDHPEPALAPAPRLLAPLPARSGYNDNDNGTENGGFGAHRGTMDTWERSLEDSDYDDDFVPVPAVSRKAKVDVVKKEEWTEAYALIKDFARHGGAIIAVDVESYEHNHDYILEVGLARVNWQAGNAAPPPVKAEHIIIEEHIETRNQDYVRDNSGFFAFGTSRTMKEDDVQLHLQTTINLYSKSPTGQPQPLVLLFHNAAAETRYFSTMGIDLAGLPTRVPGNLLRHLEASAHGVPTAASRSREGQMVFDTQRLYRAFLECYPEYLEERDIKGVPGLKLGTICKALDVSAKALHNAGNDALYTLKVFMRLIDLHAQALKSAPPPEPEEADKASEEAAPNPAMNQVIHGMEDLYDDSDSD